MFSEGYGQYPMLTLFGRSSQLSALLSLKITVVRNEMSVLTSGFADVWSQIKQIRLIFAHVKLP